MLDDVTAEAFVVVSAADAGFYSGLYTALLTIRRYLPDHQTIIYDLGLKKEQVEEVSKRKCLLHGDVMFSIVFHIEHNVH